MADMAETIACLRIFGDDLDPDEMTKLLGCSPTASARKGDVRAKKFKERTGRWQLQADVRVPGDLNGQLKEIFAKLVCDIDVWKRVTTHYECDVFCGLFMSEVNEGIELDPSILLMLGSRGIQLGLDIYGPIAKLSDHSEEVFGA
ncbi:hypothetical protein JOD31_003102 [Methylopila capsulata]|uniref:DUF4279 domain-containing protein n=1 Tax=Methylopila capsulata TaxID=61654 RepID=A0A9W6IXI7_9HYPH|nr:DUF4279 domain-containing protein [Methylopila capsulata]MBM7852860.1 hypothetical protein [Methylopila capsulata]GLK57069.1 hypothetical protein GCM10008170_30880 [Methylopila capsulata]